MNERIKELWSQCSNTETPHYYGEHEHLQKFAELIIRECMDIVDKVYDEQTGMLVKMCRRATPYQEIINEIEEHFGVE